MIRLQMQGLLRAQGRLLWRIQLQGQKQVPWRLPWQPQVLGQNCQFWGYWVLLGTLRLGEPIEPV